MDVVQTEGNVTISLENNMNKNKGVFKNILLYVGIFISFILVLKIISTCIVYNKYKIEQKRYIELKENYGSIYMLLYRSASVEKKQPENRTRISSTALDLCMPR